MDLVKCDGAALYYQGQYYPLGVTPTESQIKDIVEWLLTLHGDPTGLSTDSLADAGYPGAAFLGDAVCGMAVAYIAKRDFLFWFRSHTVKEVKWSGAKHHPEDKDDGQRMHPRSSFKAFLEVVKSRSLPWENAEMDAIHSLHLILRDSFRDAEASNSKVAVHTQLKDMEFQGMDELTSVAREMVRLIETATAPIFAVDVDGRINGWNAKVAELIGLSVEEAMGKSLVHDIVYKEYEETVGKLLHRAEKGAWADKIRVTDTNTRCTLNPSPRKPIGFRLQLNGSLWEKSAVDWRRCLVVRSGLDRRRDRNDPRVEQGRHIHQMSRNPTHGDLLLQGIT